MTGPGVGHGARDGQRMDPIEVLLIERDKSFILAGLAANTGTGDDSSSARQFRVDSQSRIGHRLARRDYRELREPVQQRDFIGLKVSSRIVVPDFCAILETQ